MNSDIQKMPIHRAEIIEIVTGVATKSVGSFNQLTVHILGAFSSKLDSGAHLFSSKVRAGKKLSGIDLFGE